jgi:predicted phosphodiesterase
MRILVISDIHANLVALETVLHDAEGNYDAIWCLGDVVGYGPRPNECVALVRERAALCVIGNHDWAALDRPGINVDDFNPHARQAVLWTQAQLTAENRDYLNGLADQPVRPIEGESLLLTHASPREPVWEYVLTPTVALENFAAFDEAICLVGHTHKPAIFRWRLQDAESDSGHAAEIHLDAENGDGPAGQRVVTVSYLQPTPDAPVRLAPSATQRLILNPGSVGQPRDNDARAAYALLDLDRKRWLPQRVTYPLELTQNQMRDAGLPRRLIDRLSFGW